MKYVLPEENSLQFMQLPQMMSLSLISLGNQQGNFCNHQGKKDALQDALMISLSIYCVDKIVSQSIIYSRPKEENYQIFTHDKKLIENVYWHFTVYLISKFHRKTCTENSFQMEKYKLLMML